MLPSSFWISGSSGASWGLILLVCFSGCVVARQIGSLTGDSGNLSGSSVSASSLDHTQSQVGRPVELAWGISEVQAQVGKLLNFSIPKDAFDGEIVDIKVTEADKPSLPSWLTFDAKHRLFNGFPFQPSTVGVHYIRVTVFGIKNSIAKDVFSIVIRESSLISRCQSEAAETVISLILDLDWESLSFEKRLNLLGKFDNFMDIPVGDLKMSPVTGSGAASALLDATAMIAGPGNAKEVKHGAGVKMSAVVGCDGRLDENHKTLATFVEEAAKDGSMARFTGADVVGWHLSTSKPLAPAPRNRRQHWLNTPEPSPIMPTLIHHDASSVHATPYIPNTPLVESVYGSRDIDVTEVYGGIHPTATVVQQTIVPTARPVEYGETTPPILPPPPSLPPPRVMGKPILGEMKINSGKELFQPAGELLNFMIPPAVWHNADATALQVSLKEPSDWLTVYKKDGGVFISGVPLAEDAGVKDYNLVANDGTKSVDVPFKLNVGVKDEAKENYNHEVDVILDQPHSEFRGARRKDFVDAVRTFYNDPTSEHIHIRSVKPGSTHVAWLNTSLNGRECDDAAITGVTSRIVDNDQVKQDFKDHFSQRGFKVEKAEIHKIGKCGPAVIPPQKNTGSDIYISTVVPAVVVSSLLLLACCIACILYRKRRRGKMSTAEHETIFKGQNKPVILQGENYDNSSKGNGAGKKPTILTSDQIRAPSGGTLPPPYNGSKQRPAQAEHELDPLISRTTSPPPGTIITHVREETTVSSPSHRNG